MENEQDIIDARKKLMERYGGDAPSRLGGKGTVRRKKRAPTKPVGGDDKKLQAVLKRLSLSQIPGIEEVNMYKENERLFFQNPKVQASPGANTYVISGQSETRPIEPVTPSQAAFKHEILKRILQDSNVQGINTNASGSAEVEKEVDKDDAIADQVANFEEISKVD